MLIELIDKYNGHNNGMIGFGNREAGAALNKERDTGWRALSMLMDRGFIVVTSDSTFNQKKLAREWRLTHLPDDRTGHKATKEFMTWGTEKQKPVAQVRSIVAPVRRQTTETSKKADHSRTHATVLAKTEVSQSRQCDTSRYTISPVPELAQAGPEEAPPIKGARAPEGQTSGVAVTVSDTLRSSLAKYVKPARATERSGGDTSPSVSPTLKAMLGMSDKPHHPQPSDSPAPAELSDGQRSILKWLIGHDGAASHRTTQQAFSGRIKGDEIKTITDELADMGLIRVEVEARARSYAVLEAGRVPALTDDDTAQIDLEEWLAGAEH